MNLACRLLVADLDGTLTEDGEPVAEQVVVAVREFCRRGGLFTLATGRRPLSARCYLEQLDVTIPAILFNGAWLYDPVSGCPLREKALPPAFVTAFLAWLPSLTDDVVVYRGEEVLIPGLSPRLERHFQKDGGRYRSVPGWAGLTSFGINKILVIAPS
ncbi:MAG: HAD family phosphatase, partial [Moorella sp. (in: Bacteria)]|nr:HAD family phosphatase [Moorella sp. (in: firmicutes)]